MDEIKPPDNKRPESSIDNLAETITPSLISNSPPAKEPHPTDAEPKMRSEGKIDYVEVGGGARVPGGYSIRVNPEGENPVEFYRD